MSVLYINQVFKSGTVYDSWKSSKNMPKVPWITDSDYKFYPLDLLHKYIVYAC